MLQQLKKTPAQRLDYSRPFNYGLHIKGAAAEAAVEYVLSKLSQQIGKA